ncbi:AAA family ATPase [Stenotrophomonas maltophilia]|uniref:AAA family ATPase n=1 Tax=Stenotrophomonas maltophilia TaxID=40324 RepID=UPI003BF87591
MQLISISFTGFRSPHRNASATFSGSNVSVIYGENGSGKTTFLKAISAFLSQDDNALTALSIREIKCEYSTDGETRTILVSRKEISFDWTHFIRSPLSKSRSISLGVERGISIQPLRVDPRVIHGFFRTSPSARNLFKGRDSSALELASQLSIYLRQRHHSLRDRKEEIYSDRAHQNLENIKLENIERLLLNHFRSAKYFANLKVQSALFNTLSDSITNSNANITPPTISQLIRVYEYRDRLIDALSTEESGEANSFKLSIVTILESLTEDNLAQEIQSRPILFSLFENIIEELEHEDLALLSINLLVETFNKYLIDGKKLVVTSDEIFVSVDDQRHSVHELSSGERHILTFLSLVLFVGQDREFLIIDEPEISLNIKWQRQLIDLFQRLIPNTQIIVASHSPIIAKNHPEYLTPLVTK